MIIVVNDPSGLCHKDYYPIKDGMRFLDWAIDIYGPDGFHVPTQVFKDLISPDGEIDLDDHRIDGLPLKESDNIIVVHRPQGLDPFTFFAISAIIGLAISTFLTPESLAQTPLVPEFKQPTESPNNSLSGQTNIVRPLQRMPDIYGKNLVFPDLIAKPYFEFTDHIKTQFEYMCVGRGEFLVEEEKTGDTLLGNIDGTISQIFQPFTAPVGLVNVTESNEVNGQDLFGPNVEKIAINQALTRVTSTNTMKSTDGAMSRFSEMVATEQFTLTTPSPAAGFSAGASFSGALITSVASFSAFSVGDFVDIVTPLSNAGFIIVSAVSENEMECIDPVTGALKSFTTETTVGTALLQTIPDGGTVTFSSYSTAVLAGGIIEHTIIVTGTPLTVTVERNTGFATSSVFRDPIIGPFNVPGAPDEIWIDILGPRGIGDFSGATPALLTIELEIRLQQVTSGGTPIGSVEKSNFIISEKTRDARFFTVKTTPAVPGGFYTASVQRFTDTDDDPVISEKTVWGRLAGVENVAVGNFGDVTTWQVITQATEQAVKVQERKYNIIVTRRLPTYDSGSDTMVGETATGTHDAATNSILMTDSTASFSVNAFIGLMIHNTTDGSQGVVFTNSATQVLVLGLFGGTDNEWNNGDKYDIYSPTARVADAAVRMITDSFAGNKAEAQIDLAGLYDIQDALDADGIYGDKLGRFCYSFSNSRTPVNDEINTALRSCRMFKFQEGNTIKFGRDEILPNRTTIFNRRIKKPDTEIKSIRLFKLNDFDGISLEWVDEVTGEGETIVFPEPPTAEPINPQRVQAAGVKNYDQAWNLAAFEFAKLIHRRTTVQATLLRDGLLVFPNARVGNSDSTTLTTQDGEVIGFVGQVVETSEPIDFDGNPLALVILRGESGDAEPPIIVAARTDGVNGFILALAPENPLFVRGDIDNYQMGTLYSFSSDADFDIHDFTVQDVVPRDDGYVDVTMINYDEDVFDADTETPTPRP